MQLGYGVLCRQFLRYLGFICAEQDGTNFSWPLRKQSETPLPAV